MEKPEEFRTSTGLTRDLAIPVRRSNQLSYEATDVGSWSFVGSYFPVRNESMNEMIYEMNHLLNNWLDRRTGTARSRVQTLLKS